MEFYDNLGKEIGWYSILHLLAGKDDILPFFLYISITDASNSWDSKISLSKIWKHVIQPSIKLTQFLWLPVIVLFSRTLWFNFDITALMGLGLNLPALIQIIVWKKKERDKLLNLYVLIRSSKEQNSENYSFYLAISSTHLLAELHFYVRQYFRIQIT